MVWTKSICVMIVALATFAMADFSNISYSFAKNWDDTNLKLFQLNGDATIIKNAAERNGRLGLCRSLANLAGSAYLLDPVDLSQNASFSTAMTLQMDQPGGISDNDGVGADGIVFIINSKTNVLGAIGQGIGYSGIGNSIGIEFDTYNNGIPIDYNGNHIGINVGGNQSSQVYYNVPKRMNDGTEFYAWIDYNGTAQVLEVRYLSGPDANGLVTRPASPILSYKVNLVKVFNSNSVYVGFSSATGSAYGAHWVTGWTFKNFYQPIATAPIPLTTSPMTTAQFTSAAMTTASMTTKQMTTQAMTTQAMTTQAMTTQAMTTNQFTSAAMTTAQMTTASMTTSKMTTASMTTAQMTTAPMTTAQMTTAPMTTAQMTTAAMTTAQMTTSPMTTSQMTTAAVTTAALTTQDPFTTQTPFTTQAISTSVPTTSPITSSKMTTSQMTTSVMTTSEFTSQALTTAALTTSQMTTSQLTTLAMTTAAMTTNEMTTGEMTTSEMTTSQLTTSKMTTAAITTQGMTTGEMTTSEMTTALMTTSPLTTREITSSAITSSAITSAAVTTQEVTTQAITTYSNLCENVTCIKIDQCHQQGVCNPVTGKCVNNFDNGVSCDDESVCTTADVCNNGVCAGSQITPCIPYILLNNETSQIVPTQSTWLSLLFKGLMEITMFHVRIVNYPTFNSDVDDGNYSETVIKYPGTSGNYREFSAPYGFDGLHKNGTDFVAFKWVPAQGVNDSSILLTVEVNYTLPNGFNGANLHPVVIPVTPSVGDFTIPSLNLGSMNLGSDLWFSVSINALARLTNFKVSLSDSTKYLTFTYPQSRGYTSLSLNDYINYNETDYFAFRVVVPNRLPTLGSIIAPKLTVSWSDGNVDKSVSYATTVNILSSILGSRSRDTSDLTLSVTEINVPAGTGLWKILNVNASSDVTDVKFSVSNQFLKFAYGNGTQAVVGDIPSGNSSFGGVWINAPEGKYPVEVTFSYVKNGVAMTSTQTFTLNSAIVPISISTSTLLSVVAGETSIQSIGYSSPYIISDFTPVDSLEGWVIEPMPGSIVSNASDGWLSLFYITAPADAEGEFPIAISALYGTDSKRDTQKEDMYFLVSVQRASTVPVTTPQQSSNGADAIRSRISPGAAAGIAIGVVAGVALIAVAGVIIRRRRNNGKVQPFRFQETIEMKNMGTKQPQVFMHKV